MGSHYDPERGQEIDDDTGNPVDDPSGSQGIPAGAGGGGGGNNSNSANAGNNGLTVTDEDKKWLDDTYEKLFGRKPTAAEASDLQRMHDLHGNDASNYRDYYASQVLGPRTNNTGGSGKQGNAINFGGYNAQTRQGSPNGTAPLAAAWESFKPDEQAFLHGLDALYVKNLGRHIGWNDVYAHGWYNDGVSKVPDLATAEKSMLASPEYKSVMARGGPSTPSPAGGPANPAAGSGSSPAMFDNSGNYTSSGQDWFSQGFQQYQPFNEKFQAPEGAPGAFVAPTEAEMRANDPGFEARMKAGQQAMERSAAAHGNLLTGGTARGLGEAMQDYGANEYQNYYGQKMGEYQTGVNNYSDKYNRAMQEYLNKFNINGSNQMNQIGTNRNNMLDAFNMSSTNRQLSDAENMQAFDIYNTLDNNYFNRLQSLSNSGAYGANSLAGLGSQIGDYITQMGNAQAARRIGGYAPWGNYIGNQRR